MSAHLQNFNEALARDGGALGAELEKRLKTITRREDLPEAVAAFAREMGFAVTAGEVAESEGATAEVLSGAELCDADLEKVAGGAHCVVSMGGRCLTWWTPQITQYKP